MTKVRMLLIAVFIAAVMALHYLTPADMAYFHAAYRMLFYFPLVLGSFWFGLRGAIVISAIIIILYLPHMRDQWHGFTLDDFHHVLEGVLFVSVGIILGLLAERERMRQKAFVESERLAAVGKAVSEIAHDMKTPLMAIGGFAEQCARTMDEKDPKRKKLEIVVEQTSRMETMVKDMLAIGKEPVLDLTSADLNDIVSDASVMAQTIAVKANVRLRNVLDPDLPPVMIDEEKVRRVVCNLLTNAIQASGPGEEIVAKTRKEKEWVTVEVNDHGYGVAAEDQAKLFTPFFSTKRGGTGLGLSIAKKFAEAHGGRVTFKPNSEKGATFVVQFPL